MSFLPVVRYNTIKTRARFDTVPEPAPLMMGAQKVSKDRLFTTKCKIDRDGMKSGVGRSDALTGGSGVVSKVERAAAVQAAPEIRWFSALLRS